jgi:hypothetical protein
MVLWIERAVAVMSQTSEDDARSLAVDELPTDALAPAGETGRGAGSEAEQ